MAVDKPLAIADLAKLFKGDRQPIELDSVRQALIQLQDEYAEKGVSIVEVASGFRVQIDQQVSPWISKLFEERPPRYTRALLETLALVAYRQPVTRSEIEEVRGVAVSTNIIKTLLEREWVRVVGHKDVPGRPAMYATTKEFLDYFNLKRIDELPPLSELTDLDSLALDTQLEIAMPAASPADDAVTSQNAEDEQPESDGDTVISKELAEDSSVTLH